MEKNQFLKTLLSLVATLFLFSFTKPNFTIKLSIKSERAQVQYAVKKIQELKQSNAVVFSDVKPDITIRISMDSLKLKPEAYKIVSKAKVVEVRGGNNVGIMYGLLEVANQIKAGKKIIEEKEE